MSAEQDLYWAIRSAQQQGLGIEEFLKLVKQLWLEEREEQLMNERKWMTPKTPLIE